MTPPLARVRGFTIAEGLERHILGALAAATMSRRGFGRPSFMKSSNALPWGRYGSWASM